jgi:hypothetical protein
VGNRRDKATRADEGNSNFCLGDFLCGDNKKAGFKVVKAHKLFYRLSHPNKKLRWQAERENGLPPKEWK